eukprot:Ihof_evm4s541 gene=Ihof_evmTU4s541
MLRRLAIKHKVELSTSSSEEESSLVVVTRETKIVHREQRLLGRHQSKPNASCKKKIARLSTDQHQYINRESQQCRIA